ncbi:Ribosomal protein lysine methyltransferase [Pestalotiopsis sp. IQ-011]
MDNFLTLLGPEVDDPDEETFLLFSRDIPSQNLGFVDARATKLELTVAGRDYVIHQSPTVLSSNRAGGTTGAVLWKITPMFAEWFTSPNNPLWKTAILTSNSAVLELGCGISGLTGLALAPSISKYVLSDQSYVSKFVESNLAENASRGSSTGSRRKGKNASAAPKTDLGFTPLDWELDEVTSDLTGSDSVKSFDVVIACDCIYNDALIQPLVQTCVDVCRLRESDTDGQTQPAVCIV